jgi:hypothetical protein
MAQRKVQGDILLNVASPSPIMQGCMFGDIFFLASSAIHLNWGWMRTPDLLPCIGREGISYRVFYCGEAEETSQRL